MKVVDPVELPAPEPAGDRHRKRKAWWESWVAKALTHPQRPSNRLRDPSWPSPESTSIWYGAMVALMAAAVIPPFPINRSSRNPS
jgi:hypothetical protein